MARRIRTRRPSGFTLIEVLLAASFTAAVCTVATMLIQSISHADSASGEKYAGVGAARDTVSCIDMLVEEAALVGYWDVNQVLLWRNDDNGDGRINLSEMTLVYYDTGGQELRLYDVPVSGPQNIAVSLSQFVGAAGANLARQNGSARVRTMVSGLSAFESWCNGTGGAAQAVQMTLTVGPGDDAQAVHAVMTLRDRTREVVP